MGASVTTRLESMSIECCHVLLVQAICNTGLCQTKGTRNDSGSLAVTRHFLFFLCDTRIKMEQRKRQESPAQKENLTDRLGWTGLQCFQFLLEVAFSEWENSMSGRPEGQIKLKVSCSVADYLIL